MSVIDITEELGLHMYSDDVTFGIINFTYFENHLHYAPSPMNPTPVARTQKYKWHMKLTKSA